MTQKQYDDMTSIMQFGRTFSDMMRKAMENCGLLQKGFFFNVDVCPVECEDGTVIMGAVRLRHRYDIESDHEEDMEQLEYNGERWCVINDPYAKTGTVPPEIRAEKKSNDRQGMGKASGKPYPPDNLWISSRDNYSDVDSRW